MLRASDRPRRSCVWIRPGCRPVWRWISAPLMDCGQPSNGGGSWTIPGGSASGLLRLKLCWVWPAVGWWPMNCTSPRWRWIRHSAAAAMVVCFCKHCCNGHDSSMPCTPLSRWPATTLQLWRSTPELASAPQAPVPGTTPMDATPSFSGVASRHRHPHRRWIEVVRFPVPGRQKMR